MTHAMLAAVAATATTMLIASVHWAIAQRRGFIEKWGPVARALALDVHLSHWHVPHWLAPLQISGTVAGITIRVRTVRGRASGAAAKSHSYALLEAVTSARLPHNLLWTSKSHFTRLSPAATAPSRDVTSGVAVSAARPGVPAAMSAELLGVPAVQRALRRLWQHYPSAVVRGQRITVRVRGDALSAARLRAAVEDLVAVASALDGAVHTAPRGVMLAFAQLTSDCPTTHDCRANTKEACGCRLGISAVNAATAPG